MPFDRIGPEFLVNTTTYDIQRRPAVATLSGGNFVAVWLGSGITGQIFAADGTKIGGEFQVNTTSASTVDPSVSVLEDGKFVVSWTDYSATGDDTSDRAVRAQMFNADGTYYGSEFVVNTTTDSTQFQGATTALPDGGFVVTWTDWSGTSGDASLGAVRAQVFAADGTRLGGELLVNTATDRSQSFPSIAALSDGRFVVTWTDDSRTGADTSYTAVRGQIFDSDGTKLGTAFLANTTVSNYQEDSCVAALSDGRFIVTWTDRSATGGDTSYGAIRAQIYAADGTRLGGEFLVNTTTENGQGYSDVIGLSDGRFVVTWTDYSYSTGDTSAAAVRAQLYSASGQKSGFEFVVNTTWIGTQEESAIAALPGGRFLVTYSSLSGLEPDPSSYGVLGQIFDPTHFGGTSGTDTVYGGTFADSFEGGGGADALYGEGGNDTLTGDAGDNTIDGGAGWDVAGFGVAMSDATIAANGNGTWRVSYAGASDILTSIELAKFSDGNRSLRIVTTSDFNASGLSGVAWFNPANQDFGLWLPDGRGDFAWSPVGGVDSSHASPTMNISGTGDFGGDGVTDVLWRNPANGYVGCWTMDGASAVFSLVGAGSTTMDIAGIGDFNADGSADILWQNPINGFVGVWMMNDGAPTWKEVATGSTTMQIAAVADFSGDGTADILWRNPSNNLVGLWAMNTNMATWSLAGQGSTTMDIVGAGDFNGDGTADILWRNQSSGFVGYWAMRDGMPTWYGIGESSTAFQVVATGDYNGDGTTDILWRNANSGDVGMWGMNNGVPTWRYISNSGHSFSVVT